MKPNFALNLSHEGIGLLHRKKGGKDGWTLIGEVGLDDDEMSAKLAVLRKTAADLEKGGLATKLIIPNSQILYTEIEAPGPDDIAREVQIRKGLEGLTPYDVGELVFDWRKGKAKQNDKIVRVAVLARETLKEAEQFAKEHRFNPVSFVARPEGKGFKGEAFFGKATGAAALLGPGEKVEPDDVPVPELSAKKPAQAGESQPEPKVSSQEKPEDQPATSPQEDRGKRAKAAETVAEAATSAAGKEPAPANKDAGGKALKSPADAVEPSPEAAKHPELTPPEKAQQGVAQAVSDPTPQHADRATDAPEANGAQDDDARIAALLADVPEPEAPKPAPASDKDVQKTGKPAKSKSAAASAKNQTAAPILAPFPPTPDEDEDEATPFIPSPPPPPPRRHIPADLQAKTETSLTPTGKKPVGPGPAPALSARSDTTKASKPAPAPQSAPGPVAAFSTRRDNTSAAAKDAPGAASKRNKKRPRFSLTQKLAAGTAPKGPTSGNGAQMAARRPAKAKETSLASASLAGGKRNGRPAANGVEPGENTSLFKRTTTGAQDLVRRAKQATAKSGAKVANRGIRKVSAKKDPATPRPAIDPPIDTAIAEAPPLDKPEVANPAFARPALPQTGAMMPPKQVDSEADRLTMFGARKSQNPPIGGKPRYLGLILILILLLVMAVTALSSVFWFSSDSSLFDQGGENEFAAAAIPEMTTTITGTGPDATPAPPRPIAQEPPPEGNVTPDGGQQLTPADQISPQELDQITTDLLNDTEPEPEPDPQTATTAPPQHNQILNEEAAQTRYAATGIWQKAPEAPNEPQSNRIDDLYIASIDPAISSQDAVALPSEVAREQEARPPSPLPPPEAGTSFAFDDRGLVSPTPQGTLSPDGILIFSGKPPVVPIPRPGTAAPAPTISPDALREFRPQPRPASLVEDNERVNLGGVTRVELAAIRPNARPASLQAEAAAEDGADTAPNELAIAASPTPGYRPGDFSTIVARARENADASDGSVVVAASAAAASVPSIPTRASVATQATIDNAIRLNSINLIGIYGSASSRRALVRLANGRYVKVSVGDRLNGGKVLSITETRLIYKKNGRNQSLDVLPLG